jgi:hypothetical protein
MVLKQWWRRDKTRFKVHCTSTLADPNPNHNLTLNNINEWEILQTRDEPGRGTKKGVPDSDGQEKPEEEEKEPDDEVK